MYIHVYTVIYFDMQVYTDIYTLQVRRCRAYLDSLSMDGAEVAVNCLCSARSCPTCWCPDSELANAHRGECHYRRMAEVMSWAGRPPPSSDPQTRSVVELHRTRLSRRAPHRPGPADRPGPGGRTGPVDSNLKSAQCASASVSEAVERTGPTGPGSGPLSESASSGIP
jgi:hypothetical protein